MRFERGFSRARTYPTARDWERCELLETQPATYQPALISDGTGLPFPPAALDAPGGRLDESEPAVQALIAQLARRKSDGFDLGLDGWRALARSDTEALFGHGLPPQLTTMYLRLDGGRRGGWHAVSTSTARPLRTTRKGVRASAWRIDPSQELGPRDTILRVFVTEQTRAGGQRAHGRLLSPDLHMTDDELILTMFVTPRPGFQLAASKPETIARVALPRALGERTLVDGALYDDSEDTALADGGQEL